ncbi:tetratricopeptide repeat protein [Micromonospora sp. WMMD723]|uniref:tetratricopeptide repeat protein n=1 Tax=unclassified Micromonospora TaxID=2617518 RepID=UPI003B950171
MKIRQVFGSLACGAVLLAGVTACSDDGKEPPAASKGSGDGAQTPASPKPADLLQQGIQQGQAGQTDRAKETFQKVLSIQADNKFAWFNLGYLAQSQGATAEAVTAYDRVLEIDGSYRPAMYNKAILLEEQNPDEAILLYRKIVEADRSASTAYLRLGLVLDRRNDPAGAGVAFASAVRADAKLAPAVPVQYRSPKPAKPAKPSKPAR